MIGQSLGCYKIEEYLGAGGMGVVHRATDTKLGRQVAIKVLPETFARDPERVARFEREARTLAWLNHPNIAAIHGLEENQGVRYLVLELVPGETLAERLKRGPLEISDAIGVCRQIAEGLEAAHDKGIIHRDLKPANIKITPEDKVKVLDFGLAKAFQAEIADSDLSQSPTVTVEDASAGRILGTAAYMSPEQARGKSVDKRTDIWAFGCVLYELLAGRRAFGGGTMSDSIAAVLGSEPEWSALPAETPEHLRNLLRRCLKKDPQKRLRDIGDGRLELEALAEPDRAGMVEALPPRPAPRPRVAAVAVACVILGATLAATASWRLWRRAPSPPAVTRFTIKLPPGETLPTLNGGLVFSRDGTQLAYGVAGRKRMYLRSINEFDPRAIPGTEDFMGWPAFSPDGQWIAFRQGSKWKRVAVGGGPPASMFDAPPGGATMVAWNADDTLVFGVYPAAMWRIPAAGGNHQEVPVVDPNKNERWGGFPQFLPGGKAVTFNLRTKDVDSPDELNVAVLSFETGKRKILIEGGRSAHYVRSGHLVYLRSGALYAVPFDVERLAVTGPPVLVLEGVYTNMVSGPGHFSISANGSLAYAPGGAIGVERRPVWVDRQGKVQPLPLPPRAYLHPRISPDARQLAIEVEGLNHDVYLYDTDRGTLTKMTLDGSSHSPLWTPDGKRLTYRSGMPQPFTMWSMPADRSGAAERLTKIGTQQSAASWSPDGHAVAFTQVSAETRGDVYTLDMGGERKPLAFAQSRFDEGSPRFSPDGRWIAYCSNESGQNEIYVQAYPGPGPKIQVSLDGGNDPVWKRNGGELYYRNGDKMMAVTVSTGSTFTCGKPKLLWDSHYNYGMNSMCSAPGPTSSNYDVSADGQRFLMIQEGDHDSPATEIRVVLNWSEELKRLIGVKQD